MLRVQHEKWGQSVDDLRLAALNSEHRRTRERFLALYHVATGESATQVAARFDRNDKSVRQWVKRYNDSGPDAMRYKRSGGVRPF